MDDTESKRGFSGLTDLASDISDIDDLIESGLKADTQSSSESSASHSLPRKSQSSKADETTKESRPLLDAYMWPGLYSFLKNKFVLGFIVIVFLIWLGNQNSTTNKTSTYKSSSESQNYNYTQSKPTSEVQTQDRQQIIGLEYEKPPVGTNNVLSESQICWCLRQSIRIEAIQDIIETDEGIDKFNLLVDDFNNRCGNYRYYEGSQQRAERYVEPYRNQIVLEAIQTAIELN